VTALYIVFCKLILNVTMLCYLEINAHRRFNLFMPHNTKNFHEIPT